METWKGASPNPTPTPTLLNVNITVCNRNVSEGAPEVPRNSQGSNSAVPRSASRPHTYPGGPSHLSVSVGSVYCSFFPRPWSARKTKPELSTALRLDHSIWAVLRETQQTRAAQGTERKVGAGECASGKQAGEGPVVQMAELGQKKQSLLSSHSGRLPQTFCISPEHGSKANGDQVD